MCCAHVNRRQFLGTATGMLAGATLLAQTPNTPSSAWAADRWNPGLPFHVPSKPLRVLPILMYRVPERREQTSWKSWGGVQTDEAALEEAARIAGELGEVVKRADFPLEVLPVVKVKTEEEAQQTRDRDRDATILYPAAGSGGMLRACVKDRNTVVFARHQSGPVYYWYEALSTRYLRPNDRTDGGPIPAEERLLSVDDVVIDDCDGLVWRLQALHGLHNFLGARIVAVGGPMGKYAPEAPQVARERYKLDIVEVSYEDLGRRIQAAMADPERLQRAERWTDAYLSLAQTELETDRQFVVNAFLLYGIFKDLLEETGATLFTIQQCMSTIMPMARTTACLTLSLLNDEGLGAFCESDFVIIPAGILLHYVSGKPVFLHNSTFPHKGVVTCAHCTGPRRMNGERYEPVRVLTHYESEYGAAPKVEMPIGQEVTFIDPDYANPRWIGIKGTVENNPFYDICRSQQDVRLHGHWERLLNEVRDSHWVMAYGDYLNEIGYAAGHLGIQWENVSAA